MIRLRFTTRSLMILVVVVAGILVFIDHTSDVLWVGYANVPLRFTVLDDTTGQPISGATIRLTVGPDHAVPATGADGQSALILRAMCGGRGGLFHRTRHVNFGFWGIEVESRGYLIFKSGLERFTRDPRFHEAGAVPPSIVIRLRRLPESR